MAKIFKTVVNWLFAQNTHVVGSKSNCMVGGLRRVAIHVKCDPNRYKPWCHTASFAIVPSAV